MVQDGKADGFCTVATPKRRDYCLFSTQPIVKLEFGIFFRADHPNRTGIESITTLDDIQKFSIVDYQGNGWAKAMFASIPVIWTSSQESAIRMVASGRADVIVGQITSVPHLISQLQIEQKLLFVPLKFADSLPYHLGLRKSRPDAETIMSKANAKIPGLQQHFARIQSEGSV